MRLSKEEIKSKLLDLIIIDKALESKDLNKEAEEVQDLERAAEIVRWYEDIIRTKKNGIINVAYYQGHILKKFKEKKKFFELVAELGIHRNTIIFRINFFKLCQKYPKLLKSSIGLGFFKDYHKDIKAICKEYEKCFQCWAFYPLKPSC